VAGLMRMTRGASRSRIRPSPTSHQVALRLFTATAQHPSSTIADTTSRQRTSSTPPLLALTHHDTSAGPFGRGETRESSRRAYCWPIRVCLRGILRHLPPCEDLTDDRCPFCALFLSRSAHRPQVHHRDDKARAARGPDPSRYRFRTSKRSSPVSGLQGLM
jgi:hypothetical protein